MSPKATAPDDPVRERDQTLGASSSRSAEQLSSHICCSATQVLQRVLDPGRKRHLYVVIVSFQQ